MRSRLVELRDDVRDGVANAGNIGDAARRDDVFERLRKRGKAVCRAQIRFRAVRVAAAQRCPLRVFPEEPGNGRCIDLCHVSVPTGAGKAGSSKALPIAVSLQICGSENAGKSTANQNSLTPWQPTMFTVCSNI